MDEIAAEADLAERHERREIWREGFTMALYISLSQLAVLTALPSSSVEGSSTLALTIALTSVGLVLAHQLAFRMSSRLIAEGSRLEPMAPRILRAQLAGGAFVTVLAVLPVLLFGAEAYRWSIALLLLFVLWVGYLVARTAPTSRLRSLLYVGFVAILVVGVLVVKNLVGH